MSNVLPEGKLAPRLLKNLIKSVPTHDIHLIIPPGIGHDAAGLSIGNQLVAISTDPITFASNRLATYCVAANVNDIACLGCKPRWFTMNLLLPIGTTEERLAEIWANFNQEFSKYGIVLIGGHTEVTAAVNTPVIVGQILGYAIADTLLNPSNAIPGDCVLLWQFPAIEGTALLGHERANELLPIIGDERLKKIKHLLQDPGICIWPAVEKIVPTSGLVALHDPTEGGIATALHEIADAAECGIEVDGGAIAFMPETLLLADLLKFNPLGLLASGSLLIVCRQYAKEKILAKLTGEPITPIANLIRNEQRIIHYHNEVQDLPRFDQDEIIKAFAAKIDRR